MIRADHIGVPARTKLDAARFLATVFDLEYETPDSGPFAPVRVSEEFTIVFFDSEHVDSMHVAFVADEAVFDGILQRLRSAGIAYGSRASRPNEQSDRSPAGQARHVLPNARRTPIRSHGLTLRARSDMTPASTRDRHESVTRRLLCCGAGAGPVFVTVFVAEGVWRRDYKPLRHPVVSRKVPRHERERIAQQRDEHVAVITAFKADA